MPLFRGAPIHRTPGLRVEPGDQRLERQPRTDRGDDRMVYPPDPWRAYRPDANRIRRSSYRKGRR